MQEQVWIIDDEKELADAIAKYFNMFSLRARAEYCAEAIGKIPIDTRVILLDINLGKDCGYEYIEFLRKRCPQAKILLISARSEERDLLRGYHLGADDYIVKPFSLQVMLCKVKKLLSDAEKTLEEYRGLSIDKDAMTVSRDGVTQRLKNMEFKLFYYLFCNRGKVLDKDDIIREVWGEGYYTDNTLNVHVRRIREKIEKYGGEFITTVWGVGYKFE